MTYIVSADRVLETSTTTGTGALTLAGAVTGYTAFSTISGIASGDTVPYSLWGVDSNGVPTGEWETGIGTWSTTLTRTLVTGSSNSGSVVTLSAGTKLVAFPVNSSMWQRNDLRGIGRSIQACEFMSTNNDIIEGGLQVDAINSGTVTSGPGATYANHPGCAILRSSTTANSGMVLIWGNPGWHGIRAFDPTPGGYRQEFIFRTAAANTNVVLRFGTGEGSDAVSDANTGAYFELPTSSWAMVSKTALSSSRTSNALATLSANTWYHARLTANNANTAVLFELFSEAGALLASNNHTTNIPTGTGVYPSIRAGSTSTTAVDLVTMDYASFDPGYGKPIARGRVYG